MDFDKFRVVCTGITTNKGEVLLGKKEKDEGHPYSEEWHFPGGHMDEGEEVREAVKREIEEETGLEVEVHQLVDIMFKEFHERDPLVRVFFHCESDGREAEAADDLQEIEWVEPEKLEDYFEAEKKVLERAEISNLVEKLKKMPAF
ncbi:MAG: NUDIX hydrolase [Candidatus Nanohaloarchaea archaeon]